MIRCPCVSSDYLATYIQRDVRQIVKAPKLHFFVTGLLCHLLGIRKPQQLRTHPLRGAIFESWVVSELYKGMVHRGCQPSLFHYHETRGVEVDLLMEQGQELTAIEIKSRQTSLRNSSST